MAARSSPEYPPQGFYPAAPERPCTPPQPADGLDRRHRTACTTGTAGLEPAYPFPTRAPTPQPNGGGGGGTYGGGGGGDPASGLGTHPYGNMPP